MNQFKTFKNLKITTKFSQCILETTISMKSRIDCKQIMGDAHHCSTRSRKHLAIKQYNLNIVLRSLNIMGQHL